MTKRQELNMEGWMALIVALLCYLMAGLADLQRETHAEMFFAIITVLFLILSMACFHRSRKEKS